MFGEKNADKVEQQLLTRNVDVLWLGSNPSVKTGLDRILDTHSDDSHFKTFIAQMESGMFSQHAVDAGASITWNPLQKSNHKWELYRDAISNSADININAVAMANFIPWGSPNMEKLAVGVSGTDPRLWNRMLEFSNHLNIQIVEKLKPKLLIVPRSLGDTSAKAPKFLRGLGIVNEEARNLRPGCGRFGVGMQRYWTGVCVRGRAEVPVAYLNHPDALRVPRENRQEFVGHFAEVISQLTRGGSGR